MSKARRLIISGEAEDDLKDIGRYTESRWGKSQRKEYLLGAAKIINKLAKNPYLGSSRDDIRADLRSMPYRAHIVFYIFDDQVVSIVRVLHQNMDTEESFLDL
jgi:toxin ParE1/3/4